MIQTFSGYRPNPPTEYRQAGITNAGQSPDYEGVIFSDGTVAIRWLTDYPSHSVWNSMHDFYQVHGHPEYGTRIEWTATAPRASTFIDEKAKLLGKRVRITLDSNVVIEGKFLGFGTDGQFQIDPEDNDGTIHYCWPLLDIEEIAA